jgi:hypothetical protein
MSSKGRPSKRRRPSATPLATPSVPKKPVQDQTAPPQEFFPTDQEAKDPGGRPTKLTPETVHMLLKYIRADGYDWVAAEAAGISSRTFVRWMRQGDDDDLRGCETPFWRFWRQVREARSEARLAAEVDVKRANPESWLRNGPGRSWPGEPGWTSNGDGSGGIHQTTVNVLVASPEWIALRNLLLNALAPYPEARLAVATALARAGGMPDSAR